MEPQVNRCLYLDAQHRLTLRMEPIPEPKPGEVLVRILANGICGSDLHFYQQGSLGHFVVEKPYIPGHEASGRIAALGPNVKGRTTGEAVVIEPGIPCGHCVWCRRGRYNLCPDVIFLSAPPINGTFCDYLAVRAEAVWPIPDGLSFETAALAEPAAVAVHAIKRARSEPGASAWIIGAGPIGLMVIQAFKAAGGGLVYYSEQRQSRQRAAASLGALPWDGDGSIQVDVAFDTSGSADACARLFDVVKPGGCAVQVGWPSKNQVVLDIATMIDKELDYVAVNRYANAFPAALQWLADGRIRTDQMVTHHFKFNEVAEAFRFTATHPEKVIKTVVTNDLEKA